VVLSEYDWQAEKKKLTLVGRKPDPEKRRAHDEALLSTRDRFRQAAEATKRGASREEIRLIMEA
jgi:hypothetical protein